jgi:hypothetical protein
MYFNNTLKYALIIYKSGSFVRDGTHINSREFEFEISCTVVGKKIK